jgi:cupin fold WbuC family metalloprotein
MRVREVNAEVLVAEGAVAQLDADDVAELKRRAAANERRRIRVCAHRETDDPLHEMLIVHTAGAYVRPHRHPGKSESAHVVEGEADLVLFGDDGAVRDVVELGPHGSGRRFYYRLAEPVDHTLLIRSPFFVFHETTNGPFRREQTEFARWAPDENDREACEAYLRSLGAAVEEARR